MLREIRFLELTTDGDREIGRARLDSHGRARLIGLPQYFADGLREQGALNASGRRLYLPDGAAFLRACVDQFSGTYLRAMIVRTR